MPGDCGKAGWGSLHSEHMMWPSLTSDRHSDTVRISFSFPVELAQGLFLCPPSPIYSSIVWWSKASTKHPQRAHPYSLCPLLLWWKSLRKCHTFGIHRETLTSAFIKKISRVHLGMQCLLLDALHNCPSAGVDSSSTAELVPQVRAQLSWTQRLL